MNHFKDLISAADGKLIVGLFQLGSWMRDYIDELQVGALMSSMSTKLQIATTPCFKLIESAVQAGQLSIQVFDSPLSNQAVHQFDVLESDGKYRLIESKPEQLSLS